MIFVTLVILLRTKGPVQLRLMKIWPIHVVHPASLSSIPPGFEMMI